MTSVVLKHAALGVVVSVAAVAALTFWGASLLAEELYEALEKKPEVDHA